MAKRSAKTNQAVNSEIELPEAIIQQIQSYLSAKQAAQTSVLSKPWYSAWSTRPILDFDQRNFRFADEFSDLLNKTVKRYQDLNLKIETFRLHMVNNGTHSVSLANELIVKALNMGVNHLDLELRAFDLPHEVFEAESLVRLSAIGCRIDPLVDRKEVPCLMLRCLCLAGVCIEECTVWDIISRSPLIENVRLSNCLSLVGVNRVLDSKGLNFRESLIGSVVDNPFNVCGQFSKLNRMFLEGVHLDNSFFRGFSRKFPFLEDLTLHYCNYYKAIQISSDSLKHISLEDDRVIRIKFDVPSIRKFTYDGKRIPAISFKSSSSEWESNISVSYSGRYLPASWFCDLKRFLRKLSQSRVSLNLPYFMHERLENDIDYFRGVERLAKPVVENLMLVMHLSSIDCPALLDGLFFCCCPKIISLTWSPSGLIFEEGNNKLLRSFKELIEQVSDRFRVPQQNMWHLLDPENINLELADETFRKWQPMLWKTWLDIPPNPEYRYRIRLNVRFRTT